MRSRALAKPAPSSSAGAAVSSSTSAPASAMLCSTDAPRSLVYAALMLLSPPAGANSRGSLTSQHGQLADKHGQRLLDGCVCTTTNPKWCRPTKLSDKWESWVRTCKRCDRAAAATRLVVNDSTLQRVPRLQTALCQLGRHSSALAADLLTLAASWAH
jgi:hypothetical protein